MSRNQKVILVEYYCNNFYKCVFLLFFMGVKSLSQRLEDFKKYDLNHKVDTFIKEYSERLKKTGGVTDIGEFYVPQRLRDFIESKAVYAELRWPYAYSSYTMDYIRQRREDASKIFTWEKFEKFGGLDDPRMVYDATTTEQEINQQALYRVIERGGARSGSRRGVLFAQEFGLDINIPVSYGVDLSDPQLYFFLEPLIPELNLETICPVGYFMRNSKSLNHIKEIKLEDLLLRLKEEKSRLELKSANMATAD